MRRELHDGGCVDASLSVHRSQALHAKEASESKRTPTEQTLAAGLVTRNRRQRMPMRQTSADTLRPGRACTACPVSPAVHMCVARGAPQRSTCVARGARLSGLLRRGRYAMEAVSHLELSGIFYHCNASATAVPQAAVMVRAAARPARRAAMPGAPVAAAAASPGPEWCCGVIAVPSPCLLQRRRRLALATCRGHSYHT